MPIFPLLNQHIYHQVASPPPPTLQEGAEERGAVGSLTVSELGENAWATEPCSSSLWDSCCTTHTRGLRLLLSSAWMGVSFFSCGQLTGMPSPKPHIHLFEGGSSLWCNCNPRLYSGKSTLLVPLRVGVISPFHDVTMSSRTDQDPNMVHSS